MNRKTKICIGILAACMVLLLGGASYYLVSGMQRETLPGYTEPAAGTETGRKDDSISYNGKNYVYNDSLKNILFMGVDKQGEIQLSDMPGRGGQTDSLMLFVLNKEEKTFFVLQISRDTMVTVDIYDLSGKYYTSQESQLSLQYAYGNGERRSCWLKKEKVSELLYGLPIDGYLAMNISGIGLLNDAVGGVTLTVPEDYTDIDEAFAKGASVTLNGALAEKYVRGRDTETFASNEQRMERQKQYVEAFLKQARQRFSENENFVSDMISRMDSYLVTDLTAEQLKEYSAYTHLEGEDTFLPGENTQGEVYDEYRVDDEKLYGLLIKLFYKEI